MEEWKYWIALSYVNGIGEVGFRHLINKFQNPFNVFRARSKELESVDGIGEKTAQNIINFREWDRVEKEIQNIKKHGYRLIVLTDPDYPKNLTHIFNPPPFIYIKGNIIQDDRLAIAVVGSRVTNRYGRAVAERFTEELVSRGITIVSGMARGIDSVAHHVALRTGGRTIAVLGSGLDVVYPPENIKLYEEISENGAVISELPLGSDPDAVNFPKRNRIISGLSLGVVVVQASQRSGSLITASYALEQNREVFAVPGNIGSALSGGTNRLIKQGAKLVDSVDDILTEIEAFRTLGLSQHSNNINKLQNELSDEERTIYSIMKSEPVHIDEIISISGTPPSKVLSILLSLELNGLVTQLPGMMFQIKRV